eukprot:123316_1
MMSMPCILLSTVVFIRLCLTKLTTTGYITIGSQAMPLNVCLHAMNNGQNISSNFMCNTAKNAVFYSIFYGIADCNDTPTQQTIISEVTTHLPFSIDCDTNVNYWKSRTWGNKTATCAQNNSDWSETAHVIDACWFGTFIHNYSAGNSSVGHSFNIHDCTDCQCSVSIYSDSKCADSLHTEIIGGAECTNGKCSSADPNVCSDTLICPTMNPSLNPTSNPSFIPSVYPTLQPSMNPSIYPSVHPSCDPSVYPTLQPLLITSTRNTCAKSEQDCNGICFGDSNVDSCGNCLVNSSEIWNNCIGCNNIVNSTFECNRTCGATYGINKCGYCTDKRFDGWYTNHCVYISNTTNITLTTIDVIVTRNNENKNDKNNKSQTYVYNGNIFTVIIISIIAVGILIFAVVVYRKKKLMNVYSNKNYEESLLQETSGNVNSVMMENIEHDVHRNKHSIDDITNIQHHHEHDDIITSINSTSIGIPIGQTMEDNMNYFIGERLLIQVKKLLNVEATVIDIIDNGKFIIVQYDYYNNKGTEKLDVANDKRRIKPLKQTLKITNEVDDNVYHKNSENDIEDSIIQEQEECVICMDNIVTYACIPCGHYCVCKRCKDLIDNKCPICQAKCTVCKIFK